MEKPLLKISLALLVVIFIANYSEFFNDSIKLISYFVFATAIILFILNYFTLSENFRLPMMVLISSFALFIISTSTERFHKSDNSLYIEQKIKGEKPQDSKQDNKPEIKQDNQKKKKIFKKKYKSDDYVKLPDTSLLPKEEVEKKLTDLGFKVQFFDANLQYEATRRGMLIPKGTCKEITYGYASDGSAVIKLYSSDNECRDGRTGLYAEEGATITVGYATRDYDGRYK
ncbi:hypothetical protein [Floricoccus penangensis]|uniref:PASTA domain-containing protein n=1 Tax=Floricoccus penangensis TaxID=1859475 RepID=A0A9Q5JF76_9LACT|nr:hypothetical protein [Floricoccus penangensis]OFI45822.1 hypothetical protein BG262_07425 [Floricoccus penangensis]URZ87997.1 hypothetical protein KIW23_02915 [Floricoccus penangensis]